ncbi:amino acid permease 8-like protein [Cinnamomum micranthum f. kanehirae]|uniref:Amino acid permease 8-like protein n=1 Tax=Cinnamomum micranthum f. kanehirae TaxID=337451 RepID=A0A443PHY1_9MAGN|nr:amino acid permease 8-like protein [Cinnamomum micranthum f. kanehirae]
MEVGEDGRTRTGNIWTATAHAITAVIGSGVLTLPWSVAQIGWVFGPIALVVFALFTYYTAIILSDCYRTPGPTEGRRNYTYMDAVKSFLGPREVKLCGIAQYASLWGTLIGYTITSATSMMYVEVTDCYHLKGHNAGCRATGTSYLIIFGAMEVILSQFPNLEEIAFLSVLAAVMSFAYSFIGLYLSTVKFASNHVARGTITGVKIGAMGVSSTTKTWFSFQALGNIAFAYSYSSILLEIQDTLKSPPPENKTMKKATTFGLGITTLFYISLGCMGYAAFGNDSPGNVLTGFYEPFWLVDIGHLAVLIHLIAAYQVFAQPIFARNEKWLSSKWPTTGFFHTVHTIRLPFAKKRSYRFTLCKLFGRTIFVVFTTLVAMMLPFFNSIVGLLGAVAFFPLTIYFPVSMYMVQANIKKWSGRWLMLQIMCITCLLVSVVSVIGSVADIVLNLKKAKLFEIKL